MSLTNDQITAKNFKEFYEAIRPYLNGSFPTAIANKFDKANMYSTDEQIVGRWIDGKPLYQKTVHITNISSDNIELISSGVEYAKLVDVEYVTSGVLIQTGNWWASASDYINLRIVCNEAGKITLVILQSRNPVSEVYATIQYTKTTDTAINIGSDTDYSTTEKIVGTWIDGKPIYQKTWDLGSQVAITTSWATISQISPSSVNMNKTISVEATKGGDSSSSDNPAVQIWGGVENGSFIAKAPTGVSVRYVTVRYTKTTD